MKCGVTLHCALACRVEKAQSSRAEVTVGLDREGLDSKQSCFCERGVSDAIRLLCNPASRSVLSGGPHPIVGGQGVADSKINVLPAAFDHKFKVESSFGAIRTPPSGHNNLPIGDRSTRFTEDQS